MGEPFTSDFKITTREPSYVMQNPDDDKMKAHSSSKFAFSLVTILTD